MKGHVASALIAAFGALVVIGCASAPKTIAGSSEFLQKGMASPRLKGNEFYMVIGEVELYSEGFFGGLSPTGKTAEIAAVIQSDEDTGEILRIATARPGGPVSGDSDLADLRGGISIIDAQPYPRWLDAIGAMRDAFAKLDPQVDFIASDKGRAAPDFAVVGVGWGWGRPGFFHHRHWR